jgi:hypothetical protein
MSNPDFPVSEFEVQVADALEHLWDYAYLGTHPLSELDCVQHRVQNGAKLNHVGVGRALSDTLQDAIKNLETSGCQNDHSRERHYYTILFKAYVDCVKNRTIADSLNIGERTLYRYSIKAIQCVARILHEWG